MTTAPRPGPPPGSAARLVAPAAVPDDDAPLRVRLTEHTDAQAAREAVDNALRLLGLDLFARGEAAMPEGWEQRPVRGAEGEVVSAHDPAMWFKLLQSRDHPVRAAFPPVHGALVRDLRRALDIRHDLYHFRITHDLDDAVAHLHVLQRVARQLRLPCSVDIKRLKAHLQELSPRDLGLVVRPREEVEREMADLRRRIEEMDAEERQLREESERARDDLGDARELVAVLRERGDAATEAQESSERRVHDLEQRIAELERRAAASARAERVLSDEAARAERSLETTASLTVGAREGLELFHAGLAGLQHLVASGAMTDAAAARALVVHVDGMLMETRGLGAEGTALSDVATISRTGVRAQFADVLRRGEDVDLGSETDDAQRMWRMLTRTCQSLLAVLDGPGWRASPAPVHAGDPWPHVRGEEVWVLSAAQRRLLRPGGGAVDRRLAVAFLRWRPEGGRVYVDVDGAASTYRDGALVYLGNVTS